MHWFFSKNNLLSVFSLLTLCTTSLAYAKDDSCCKNVKKELKRLAKGHEPKCCECIPICQKKIDRKGGTLILKKSGNYALTGDVTGTIVVAADSVCIDLCCHTLSAGGRASAIIANGHEALKVFNGRIINAQDAAISVENYSSAELYNLTMSGNALDAIRERNSEDLNVHDVNFINDNSSERALLMDTCNNIIVKNCNASGFLSTIGAVIEFDSCQNGSVRDVDVTNNTKTQSSTTGSFDTSTMFVGLNSCTGIELSNVKVNNNTIRQVEGNRFAGIGFMFSDTCSMHRCQISNNTIATNVAGELYRMLFIGSSSNITVTECQANSNTAATLLGYLRGFSPFESSNLVFDGCQVNNNFAEAVDSNFDGGIVGIWLQTNGVGIVENTVIRNCQVNFNTIADGGAGRVSAEAVIAGISLQGSGIIDHCQVNNNSIGTTDAIQYVEGLILYGPLVKDIVVSNSSFDNNIGGEVGAGIVVLTYTDGGDNEFNTTISNCSASSNQGIGIWPGKFFEFGPDSSLLRNLKIVDCVCNRNGSETFDSAGIFIDGIEGFDTVSNILIKNCQVNDTFSGVSAAGIRVRGATNVVVEDTNVFATVGSDTSVPAHGILFDTVQNSKIIRTQVHGNQNSGIELVGDNSTVALIEVVAMDNDVGVHFAANSTFDCSLVQDSRALNNATAGFSYEPATLTTTFIGNESQCNGECVDFNYDNLNTRINLQELSWTNGAITNVNPAVGQAAIGARFTNIRGPGASCD